MSSFDTPRGDIIAQQDAVAPNVPPVPVVVGGVVRTDEMPCIPEGRFVILRGSASAPSPSVKIVQRNERRKLLVVQNISNIIAGDAAEGILISRTKGQCDQFVGFLATAVNAMVRYEFPWPEEVWVRGVNVASASGVVGVISAAVTDCILNVATFDWSH